MSQVSRSPRVRFTVFCGSAPRFSLSTRSGSAIATAQAFGRDPRQRRPGARQSLPPRLRPPRGSRRQRLAYRPDRHAGAPCLAGRPDPPDAPDLDPADLSAGPGLSEALDILRFRPNVVIDGEEPFAEDAWSTVRIGNLTFRTTMVCDRCVMTTIDPVTLAGGGEPIRTLARHRRWNRKTWFGTRLVPLAAGTISVGDDVAPENAHD